MRARPEIVHARLTLHERRAVDRYARRRGESIDKVIRAGRLPEAIKEPPPTTGAVARSVKRGLQNNFAITATPATAPSTKAKVAAPIAKKDSIRWTLAPVGRELTEGERRDVLSGDLSVKGKDGAVIGRLADLVTWPQPVTVGKRKFPAWTTYAGVIWNDEGWKKVLDGTVSGVDL